MAREGFRRQLKKEVEQWQQEGFISEEFYQQIADRYEFQNLTTSSQVFSTILYCLGGILIGLAVITFVAANWQALDRIQKVLLLMTWLITINTLGFHLWQRTNNYRRLGQGLLLIGGMSLGAVISLIAQTFNLSGEAYGLFLIWGIGVIIMGASLQFQTLTMLGLILLGIGYLGYTIAWRKEFNLIGLSMPVLSILLLSLSYWLESRAVFVLVVLLWIESIFELLWQINKPLCWIIPTFILWGYNDTLKLDRFGGYLSVKTMQPSARVLSLLVAATTLYQYSFGFSWISWNPEPSSKPIDYWYYEELYFGLMLGIAIYVLVSQLFLVRNDIMTKIYLGIMTIFTAFALLNFDPLLNVFIVNCLLAIFSIGLIRLGIERGERRNFWFGIILLCLQIMSRTFEYNTGLLVKAFTFALCGIAILSLGIWFERYLQNLSREVNP